MKEKVEVLISAMHQKDFSIFEKTNISTDALLINQCDCDAYKEKQTDTGIWRIFSTKERGLSRSRNMALQNARNSIILICDDDENLYDGYENKILDAYKKYPQADILCFQMIIGDKTYSEKPCRIGYLKSLRISSCQLTMRVASIVRAGIKFDVNFGSGTPLGSGEENIFMYECLKAGLKIYYVPVCLGEIIRVGSGWFKGFNEEYFFNRGKIIRRMMNPVMGFFYCMYFVFTKQKLYRDTISLSGALSKIMEGFTDKNRRGKNPGGGGNANP